MDESNPWLAILAAAIGGGFLGSIVTQFFEGRRARREQEEARDWERRERQRLALYELQDAMAHLATVFGVIGTPPNPLREPPPIDTQTMIAAVQKAIGLAIRVHDDQIRELTQDAASLFAQALALNDQTRGQWSKDVGEQMGRLQRRIAEVLEGLD